MHAIPAKPFRKSAFPHGTQLLPPSTAADALSPDVEPRIHIDLAPQLLMGAGPMVELLAKTRVGHYLDFRALDAIFLAFPADGLRRVPASRSDIFRDRFLTMPEKRLLMRFLKGADPSLGDPTGAASAPVPAPSGDGSAGEPTEADDGAPVAAEKKEPFATAMQEAGLTDKLQKLLSYAVVMSADGPGDMSKTDAVAAISLYQRSLMRFRIATPLLYANYGSVELAQAFCRLCAVRGGVYVLRRRASSLVSVPAESDARTEKRSLHTVVTDCGEQVRCKAVFGSGAALPSLSCAGASGTDADDDAHSRMHWRAACVVDGSVVRGDAKRVLLVVPRGARGNDTATVHVRQLDTSVKVCPAGMFVLYAETFGDEGSAADLRAVLESYITMGGVDNVSESEPRSEEEGLGEEEEPAAAAPADASCEAERKPNLLWGLMYARPVRKAAPAETAAGVTGVHVLGEGGAETDSSFAVEEARRLFEHVLPDAAFFEEPDDEEEEVEEAEEKKEVEEKEKSGTQEGNESEEK